MSYGFVSRQSRLRERLSCIAYGLNSSKVLKSLPPMAVPRETILLHIFTKNIEWHPCMLPNTTSQHLSCQTPLDSPVKCFSLLKTWGQCRSNE